MSGKVEDNPFMKMLCTNFGRIDSSIESVKDQTNALIRFMNAENIAMVKNLERKIDSSHRTMTKIDKKVSILETRFTDHKEMHEKISEERKILGMNYTTLIASFGSAIIASLTSLKVTGMI